MRDSVVVHAIRGYVSRTETFVGNQITSLQKYSPVVVCHHRSENREFDIQDMFVINEQRGGAKQMLADVSYSLFKTLLPFDVAAAARWIRRHNPSLLHFHYAVDAAFFLPLYRRLRLPAVVSLYGYDISSFPRIKGGLGRLYLQKTFNEMDCFLAMSEDMKRDAVALGVAEEKIFVHYHGINAQRFRSDGRTYEEKATYNILCVGTLELKKGQHHLLRALAQVRTQRPDLDVRVTLVGKGPLLDECTNLIAQLRLHDRVELAGYIPHLDPRLLEYYRKADLFVHFSTTQPDNDKEGIPGTIVEAMASGLPVITTRHAGIPEVIADGEDGVLLNEDDIPGIARSIILLLENKDLRLRLGKAAAHRALTELDVQTKTARLEEVYESIRRVRTTL